MIQEGTPLAPLTTLGVGGAAERFAAPRSEAELRALHEEAIRRGWPTTLLGGGSNVVISDAGLPGLVIQPKFEDLAFALDADGRVRIEAGAGLAWDALVEATVARGFAQLAAMSGIPGSVGGAAVQNIGAYGEELSETFEAVYVFDREELRFRWMDASEMAFAYRHSALKGLSALKSDGRGPGDAARFTVCRLRLRLDPKAPVRLRYDALLRRWPDAEPLSPAALRELVLQIRREKSMLQDPSDPNAQSVGSFFTNPVVSEALADRLAAGASRPCPRFPAGEGQVKLAAAWLLEEAGFHKGYGQGAVGLSQKHSLVIINRGGATARAVQALALELQAGVKARFDVQLLPEAVFLGAF